MRFREPRFVGSIPAANCAGTARLAGAQTSEASVALSRQRHNVFGASTQTQASPQKTSARFSQVPAQGHRHLEYSQAKLNAV